MLALSNQAITKSCKETFFSAIVYVYMHAFSPVLFYPFIGSSQIVIHLVGTYIFSFWSVLAIYDLIFDYHRAALNVSSRVLL